MRQTIDFPWNKYKRFESAINVKLRTVEIILLDNSYLPSLIKIIYNLFTPYLLQSLNCIALVKYQSTAI